MRGRTGSKGLSYTMLCLMTGLIATVGLSSQSQPGQPTPTQPGQKLDSGEDYRFRPDHEREALKSKSPYLQFQDKEGVPVYKGMSANLYTVALKPWKRLGDNVTGAYINLDGAGSLVDVMTWVIAPGAQTKAEHHLFEEQILVLSGEGETHLWQSDPAKKVTIPWKRGTVFSPPINTWHEHVNKGREPARFAAVTDLPLKIDIFRNVDFLFNTAYNFTDRYNGEADYFDPENSKDYGPKTGHTLSEVNLIRDAWTWRLFWAGQGYGDVDRHFILSQNTMTGHIESWPIGAYERAHKHGPSSTIIQLGGHGYSLMWPGNLDTDTPWKSGKADKVTRVDWEEGTVVIPPIQYYHQHFATGPTNAKFIKLGSTPGNEKFAVTSNVLEGGDRSQISFANEDTYVRELFEKELAKVGAKMIMPGRAELIKMENMETEGGRMPTVP